MSGFGRDGLGCPVEDREAVFIGGKAVPRARNDRVDI